MPFSSLLICVWQFSACSVLHDAVSRISANTRHNSGIRSQLSVSNKLFVVTMFVVWWRTGAGDLPCRKADRMVFESRQPWLQVQFWCFLIGRMGFWVKLSRP